MWFGSTEAAHMVQHRLGELSAGKDLLSCATSVSCQHTHLIHCLLCHIIEHAIKLELHGRECCGLPSHLPKLRAATPEGGLASSELT
jgi:hypothetical protein